MSQARQMGEPGPQAAWVAHAATMAVVAGYPLLEAIRTCRLQTGAAAAAPGGSFGRAPINRFCHSQARWTDRDRDIVTPANDLLYSNGWIDLRAGPVIITVPRPTGRYFVLELLDVYTNNFFNIGIRNTPADGARFALVGPGTPGRSGECQHLPAHVLPVHCPTDLVWVLGRVLVDDDDDLACARAFQAGFAIDGRSDRPFASVARWQAGGDPAVDFFSNLGRALNDFPPLSAQAGVFDALGAAGHFASAADGGLGDLRPATLQGLRQGYATALALIEATSRSASRAQWRYSTRLGRFGDDLMLRAVTAWKGLGALCADEAVYAMTDFDDRGEPLDGGQRYRWHLADGGRLPADAFWSLSLYGEDRYFVANPLGRHALGNRSALVAAADGSVTVEISRASPLGPSANWLPAPAGRFYLILRLYHPQDGFLAGHYRLAPLERMT